MGKAVGCAGSRLQPHCWPLREGSEEHVLFAFGPDGFILANRLSTTCSPPAGCPLRAGRHSPRCFCDENGHFTRSATSAVGAKWSWDSRSGHRRRAEPFRGSERAVGSPGDQEEHLDSEWSLCRGERWLRSMEVPEGGEAGMLNTVPSSGPRARLLLLSSSGSVTHAVPCAPFASTVSPVAVSEKLPFSEHGEKVLWTTWMAKVLGFSRRLPF